MAGLNVEVKEGVGSRFVVYDQGDLGMVCACDSVFEGVYNGADFGVEG